MVIRSSEMVKNLYEKPVRFKNQKYEKLYKHYHTLNILYSDAIFPPTPSSIGSTDVENVKWSRPNEICSSPCLYAGVNSKSVVAGHMSSNWIVSALSVLAAVGELYRKVIPEYRQQEWDSENNNYVGIFHFRFWRFGQWVDVVIDDMLPVCDNELLFTQSSAQNEFWIPLVEKAYAKLHGSYEKLADGHLADALVDFTGGVSETLDLRANDYSEQEAKCSILFEKLVEEIRDHSVMCSVITISGSSHMGKRTEVGLCEGRAYAITSVKKVKMWETSLRKLFQGRETFPMVRLRDPCVDGRISSAVSKSSAEQNDYAYSTPQLTRLLSKNPEWSRIKDTERERLGLTLDHEGEFWMPLEDFVSNFNELIICRLFNTNIFTVSKTWCEMVIKGEWSVGAKGTSQDRSGGGPTFTYTYLRNPQYMFDVKKDEEEIVIQMLQDCPAVPFETSGLQRHLIGFIVIKVEENRKYRLHEQWHYLPTVIAVDHIRRRELYYRGYLCRGRYILIPSTYKPGETGGHMVRMFSGSDINLRVLNRDEPRRNIFACIGHKSVWVTVINIKSAENLKTKTGGCNPYCIISCEGKKARTSIAKNTTNPLWNSSFVFYRSSTSKPLTIKVYSHRALLRNTFLGQVGIPAPLNHEPTLLRAELSLDDSTEGSLELYVLTDDNFLTV
ncbi:calpain-5-like isoform X2 [Zootermopsis nevadensis]|uniref:calpain-5-like isoform X2 n=1 Tax=Zootermopsis nevadensis TaxID=136037 RepID=UPI000B8E73CD|nr:calpain-5-like isoform X2 [Zootermopsis nevadensis]